MKFDPLSWNEVPNGSQNNAPKGKLRLLCSAQGALYVTLQNFPEVLAGVGTEFDLEFAQAVKYRLDAPKGVRVFVYRPRSTSVEFDGEVYFNLDQMPMESGSVTEVKRALRAFELERRAGLREMREEREALRLERQSLIEASAPAQSAPAAADPSADAPASPEAAT